MTTPLQPLEEATRPQSRSRSRFLPGWPLRAAPEPSAADILLAAATPHTDGVGASAGASSGPLTDQKKKAALAKREAAQTTWRAEA